MAHRWLLAPVLLATSTAAAGTVTESLRTAPIDSDSVRFVRVSGDGSLVAETPPPPDFCINDIAGVYHFNGITGAYVGCGNDGFFEQGVGTVTTQNGVVTLSHVYGSAAFQGLESVHATANPTTGQGSATFHSRDEVHGTYARLSLSTSNVLADSCGGCPAQTAINEGVLNAFPVPSSSLGLGASITDATLLQQFSLNSDFSGEIRRLTAGITRQGSGPLSFRFEVFSDRNGLPGDRIYEGPLRQYSNFPGQPTIGIVDEDVRIAAGVRFWAGYRWNPSTDPLYAVYGTNADSPLSKTAICESGSACDLLTSISNFDNVRSLYLSADYRSHWLASGGAVPYGLQPSDILSEKCDGGYIRLDLVGSTLQQLYAENGPGTKFAPSEYGNAFARITPVASGAISGIDGVAETRYNGIGYSAISFTVGTTLQYCTRPRDATDYVCHSVSGFQGSTGHFSRIVGVQAGFEISFGNAQQDRIERWMITRGPTAWNTQPLNPLLGQIGNPEFGYPWFGAASSNLGVAYEYQTPAGLPQIQLTQGNLFYGPFTLGTDVPPAGFDSNLATRVAADCTRDGLCVFGRYQTVSGKNLVDMVDFRGSVADPEIQTWQIGSGMPGLQFGRAVNLRGRDGTALYASYTPSSIANQYRLQLDAIDLTKYTKFTISDDFGAGSGRYPLSLSRADGEWGLAHRYGIDLLYDAFAGCEPARVRGHDNGGTAGSTGLVPCQIPLAHRF